MPCQARNKSFIYLDRVLLHRNDKVDDGSSNNDLIIGERREYNFKKNTIDQNMTSKTTNSS